MTVSQIANPKHQAEFAIPLGDYSIVAEHQRLCSLLRLGHLDKHAAYEKRIHNGAQQRLKQKENDAFGAFLCNISVAVAYGSFSLDKEEERRGEVVNVGYTRGVASIVSSV